MRTLDKIRKLREEVDQLTKQVSNHWTNAAHERRLYHAKDKIVKEKKHKLSVLEHKLLNELV